MKKGLLSLLVVALTVVGCQDYDDQFDSLNKEILALKTDLTTIKGLSASITAISSEIKALEGKMVSDSDITGILTQIAAVKTAVGAIPAPADVSGISTEVADLNTEIATILAQLTKIQAASGGTYAGNLNITNAVQLTAAEDIVDASADGPLMTITGNVNIDADNTGTKEAANVLRIQAILDKLKVISGSVTITGVDAALSATELLYVTGSLHVEGASSMGLPKLNTVDGSVELNLFGDLSYPLLSSAASIRLSATGGTSTITIVDFSGFTTGGVTTAAGVLSLPLATSVDVGTLTGTVNLPKATSFNSHGVAAIGNVHITAPLATSMIIKAASMTGSVTIEANLAVLTLDATTISGEHIARVSEYHGASITAISSVTTISATIMDFTALKNVTGGLLTIINAVAFSAPSLETLTKSFTSTTVSTFFAPKLTTSAIGVSTITLKAGPANGPGGPVVTVKSLTATSSLGNWGTVNTLTLESQASDLEFQHALRLSTLNFTASAIARTLTVTGVCVSITTINLAATNEMTTLTVSGTNITTLTTAGVLLNTNIYTNPKMTALNFGHTHKDGEAATTVDVRVNAKLTSLDMSTLGKVKTVNITGNVTLTDIIAPSSTVKAEPGVQITVSAFGNNNTGTYTPTIAATETTAAVPAFGASASIANLAAFIDAYNLTQTASVTFKLGIKRLEKSIDSNGVITDTTPYDDGTWAATEGNATEINTAAELTLFR
jgi:hypothetical protein